MRPALVPFFVVLGLAASVVAQPQRATERVTLTVEILAREETPTIPCGILGAQPRDVTARVLSVDRGHFEGAQILLRWPVCSLDAIPIGGRFQIDVRRFTDATDTPDMRYRVRRYDTAPAR